MSPDQLLARLAATLRHEIGPAVGEPFPKTQAFMAAVILEKLAAQLRLAEAQALADEDDRAALVADLDAMLGEDAPTAVRDALDGLRHDSGPKPLSSLVAALYRHRDGLGQARFEEVLSRVRRTLRARIDRQMAFAS